MKNKETLEADYRRSFTMWNDVYSRCTLTDLSQKELTVEPTFDVCLDLFAYYCKNVLDYGCGTGDILFQIRQFGNLNHGIGIDMSSVGISYAQKEAEISSYNNLTFLKGSLPYCKQLPDGSFDGIVLSNILDVIPMDVAIKTFEEMKRLLQPGGRMFIKLNPFYNEKTLEQFGFDQLGEHFYTEEGVLRYHILDTRNWESLFEKDFNIERYLEFPYPWQEGMNRLFLLKKK